MRKGVFIHVDYFRILWSASATFVHVDYFRVFCSRQGQLSFMWTTLGFCGRQAQLSFMPSLGGRRLLGKRYACLGAEGCSASATVFQGVGWQFWYNIRVLFCP